MILVTGGTGLVGAHLLLELTKAGEQVRAIYRTEGNINATKRIFSYEHKEEAFSRLWELIEWVEADLLDVPALERAFEGIRTVYHCAAIVSFSPTEYHKLRKTNIEGSANIVNLCIGQRIQKLCYVSSIATFDLQPGQEVISEESHWNKELDHSMYAISKYGGETEVWRASQEGVPVIIVNPGVIIGPGFWNTGSGLMFKKVWGGLKFYFPKTTGFVGVKDTVKAMRLLMNSPVENEQYILVSQNLSFREVLFQVADSLGKARPRKKIRPWMLRLGWIGELLLTPLRRRRSLTRDSARSLFLDNYYTAAKFEEGFSFSFEPISKVIADTGLRYKEDSGKTD